MKMMQKAINLSNSQADNQSIPDSICFDLEDAVTVEAKPQARKNIIEALRLRQETLDKSGNQSSASEILVRINAPGSGFEWDDIDSIFAPSTQSIDQDAKQPIVLQPDGIVIPKVEDADSLLRILDRIHVRSASSDHSENLSIIALIESSRALLQLQSIAQSTPQLKAFIFGGDDYAADIGAVRTKSNVELMYARQYVVSVAKAYGHQAIDIVNIDFNDLTNLESECRQGFEFGFTGKQCIHPKQVDVIQSQYAPSRSRIDWAQRVLAETEKQSKLGKGAFTVDGQMIDLPTIKAAQHVISLARACRML